MMPSFKELAVCSGVCFVGLSVLYQYRKRNQTNYQDESKTLKPLCNEADKTDPALETTEKTSSNDINESDSFLSCSTGSGGVSMYEELYSDSGDSIDRSSNENHCLNDRGREPTEAEIRLSSLSYDEDFDSFIDQITSPVVTSVYASPVADSSINMDACLEQFTPPSSPRSVGDKSTSSVVVEYDNSVGCDGPHSPSCLNRIYEEYHAINTPNCPSTAFLIGHANGENI